MQPHLNNKKNLLRTAILMAALVFTASNASANAINAYGTSPTITFGTGTTSATITEKMRLTAGGLLGVGTSQPAWKLTLNTSALALNGGTDGLTLNQGVGGTGAVIRGFAVGTGGTFAAPTAIAANDPLLSLNGGGYWAGKNLPEFENGDVSAALWFTADSAFTSTSQPTYITFRTTPSGTRTLLERVRIASSGNVGIGTATPTAPLTVSGTVRATQYCDINGANCGLPGSSGGSATIISGTTTMVPNFPDAITCTVNDSGWGVIQLYHVINTSSDNTHRYRFPYNAIADVIFNANGTYNSRVGSLASITTSCDNQSISQLYAAGQAFNFLGSTGAASNGYALTSGTLGLTLNSPTSIISLTAASTTWGYLGSTASYLPNFSSNGISTTNISLSTINGVSVSSLGGSASPTNVPSFRAVMSANQTGVTTGTWTKINYATKEFDNLSSYNAATSQFKPTTAGNYLIVASNYCSLNYSCFVAIYKNGTMVTYAGANVTTDIKPNASAIIPMNGTTDYVEIYGYTSNTSFSTYGSFFSASLLASGNGLISGSTPGVSAIASLTDVTLTAPTSNSILVYDGSKWVNRLIQNTISTTTMVSNWPDAIFCDGSNQGTEVYYYSGYRSSGNRMLYIPAWDEPGSSYMMTFNATSGAFIGGAANWLGQCANKSISQLYAEGRAFNFVGTADANGIKDRIVSGTTGIYTTVNTSASIATAGVERVVIGTNGRVGIGQQPGTEALSVSSTLQVGEVLIGRETATANRIEIGYGATGNKTAYLDFVGDTTYSDYGLRLWRIAGANSDSQLLHRGTGNLQFVAEDAAAIMLKTSNVERLRITSAGLVGIGKTPTVEFDVSGSIQYSGSISDVSDRRLKTNIEALPMPSAIQVLSQLTPVQFEMKTAPGTKEWGFIAQDVEKVLPLLVNTLNDKDQTKTLNYVGLIPVLVKSTQELAKENDQLKAENAQLKATQESILKRLDALEQKR